jgi:hypothetical protein
LDALDYWMEMPEPRNLTAAQRRAAKALKFSDSYSRGECLVRAFSCGHPLWPEMLRGDWSGCDALPLSMLTVLRRLAIDEDARRRAMQPEALAFLAALPDRGITAWRGCYASNARGLSWSTSREVAARFPFLRRYRRHGETPLLLRGSIDRKDIILFVMDREESEIVALPGAIREVERTELPADGLVV